MTQLPNKVVGPGDNIIIETPGAQSALTWPAGFNKQAIRVTNSATPPVDPPPVDPPPPATGPSMYRPIYGPGIECESKNNWQVGWTPKQKVSNRFRSNGGTLTHISMNERGGPGYSGGNGGVIKVTVCPDNGSGKPNEAVVLGTATWSPGNPSGHWEHKNRHAFAAPIVLEVGVLYHLVFVNTSPTQTTNYISLNDMVGESGVKESGGTGCNQPAFTNDFAVLINRGSWQVTNDTPVFDLTYADGSHDGNGYYQATYTTPPSPITQTVISGPAQVRQTMKPKVDRPLGSVAWRVKRLSGSSPLTLTIEGGGLSVAVILSDSPSIPASVMPQLGPDGNHWVGLGGDEWVKETIARTVLKAGTTYTFRLSCPSDSKYCAIPIRGTGDEGTPAWLSRVFDDGVAEKTTNGSTWSAVYPDGRHDWQTYGDLVA